MTTTNKQTPIVQKAYIDWVGKSGGWPGMTEPQVFRAGFLAAVRILECMVDLHPVPTPADYVPYSEGGQSNIHAFIDGRNHDRDKLREAINALKKVE